MEFPRYSPSCTPVFPKFSAVVVLLRTMGVFYIIMVYVKFINFFYSLIFIAVFKQSGREVNILKGSEKQ